MLSLEQRLDQLAPDLEPLANAVWAHRDRGSNLRPDGTVQVAPMPWVGPEAYAFVLYPPAPPAWLADFAQRFGTPVPQPYASLLGTLNGCFAFDLALFGLPPTLHQRSPHPGRATLEPLDLEAANRYWIRDYQGATAEFHLGGCTWTATESVGYFLSPDGMLHCRAREGGVIHQWDSIQALLAEELPAAEARDQARRARTVWPWETRQGNAQPGDPS